MAYPDGVILALASSKGGAGKTTSALHLCAALAGRPGAGLVVLIDADANRSATGWAARGDGAPFDVRPLGADTRDAEHVVIDTAGGEHPSDLLDLARRVDRVVIAAQPLAFDLLAALSTYRVIGPHTHARVLLTLCPPAPQRDDLEARDLLATQGVPVLRAEVPQRKAYAAAALEGVTVRDVRGGALLWPLWPRLLREVTP